LHALAAAAEADDLTRIFQGMTKAIDELAKAPNPRHSLEMTVVRLARRPPLVPVDALLERLGDLERRLGGSGGGAPRPPSGGGGQRPTTPQRPPPTASAPAPVQRSTSTGSVATARAVEPSFTTTIAGPIAQVEGLLTPSVVERVRAVAAKLRQERATWGSLVEHSVIIRCDDVLELAYEKRSFFAAQLNDRELGEAMQRAGVSRILLVDGGLTGRTLAQLHNEQKTQALDAARREAIAHPVVQDAIAIFKAEVRNVKLPGDE
jgi:hypothetical protein